MLPLPRFGGKLQVGQYVGHTYDELLAPDSGVAAARCAPLDGGVHGRLVAAATRCCAKTRRVQEARAPRDYRHVRRRRPLRGHAGSGRLGQHSASRVGARAAGAGLPGRAPRGAHRTLQLHRRAGHRQPAKRRRVRQRSAGHADHLRNVPQGTRAAAGRSLGDRDQQELRPDGRQQVADRLAIPTPPTSSCRSSC